MTTRQEIEESIGYKLPEDYGTGRCASYPNYCDDPDCVKATHPGVVAVSEENDDD